VVPNARLTLVGFSMSGGLVLRNAGGANGGLIDRSILISPMLGPGAPTMKPPREDAWAAPHIPRIMALSAINRIGVTALDGLEAIAYAVPPGSAWVQTGSYSWRLLRSFFPHNYAESLRAAPKPIAILVGERDELFRVDAFAPAVQQVRADVPVTVVAGIDHINMTLDAKALSALLQALQ
jgi:alpha-beta hydrolase superfamily lysophospholipase